MARGFIGVAVLSLGLVMPGLASAADPVEPLAGDPVKPLAGDPVKPLAGDPVKPDLGAGPHRDRSPQTSGEGESPRQPIAPPAVVPKADPGDASTGSSASPPASPDDERSARDREEDERRATESKNKMKKRPGFRENVPAPRASSV
jgi:hypothetical protein